MSAEQHQSSPETALANALGELLDARITDLTRLTGGASRTTWSFTAHDSTGARALILRTGPTEETHAGMELEARAQQLAGARGAPVPEIVTASNSLDPLGNPYLICTAIAGETIVRRIQRALDEDGRGRLLRQCAAALAAIHRANPAEAGLTAMNPIDEVRRELDAMNDTTATFEWAFRWLRRHRPRPASTTLVHGDFRMGNLIVDTEAGGELAAVLDWELVHAGDPIEDLAWFCIRAWRFGAPKELAAGGLGSIDEFLAAYADAGGAPIDRDAFRWWSVLATLHWGVICRFQAERHLSGRSPSVELATIGRRVCETEWDLLNLLGDLGVMTRAERVSSHPNPADELHGRPTAAELVCAVADFLDGDVRANTEGQVNFHARVAANALRMVARELTATDDGQVRAALAELGVVDEATLAAAVRRGEFDDRADELTQCLRVLVGHRLAAAHPGYEQE